MSSCDPRTLRTNESLSLALRRLAAQQPVEELTVEQLCAAAGVSRATFYRRARIPAELLAEEFEETHAQLWAEFVAAARAATGAALREVHRGLNVRLVAHIAEYADIYRASLSVDQSQLRVLLRRHMTEGALAYIDSQRERIVLPRGLRASSWPLARSLLGRNYAAGHLALIEVWLEQAPEHRSQEDLNDWLLAMSPSWDRRLMDMGGGRP